MDLYKNVQYNTMIYADMGVSCVCGTMCDDKRVVLQDIELSVQTFGTLYLAARKSNSENLSPAKASDFSV